MYDLSRIASLELYQGDIFDNYPFLNLESVRPVRVNGSKIDYVEGEVSDSVDTVIAEVRAQKIMLVSQTCDAQRRENVILCPIYELNEYININNPSSDQLRALRKGQVYYWFYLPKNSPILVESFVDLQQFIYIPRIRFESQTKIKILSLGDLGRHRLSWCISNYFGRPL